MRMYIIRVMFYFITAALAGGMGMYLLTLVCVGDELIALHSSKLMVALFRHLSKCLDIDGCIHCLNMSRLYPELGVEDWL